MLQKLGISAILVYIVLLIAAFVGWVGNLIHAFHTASTNDLVLTLVGVFVPPMGAIKFYFF